MSRSTANVITFPDDFPNSVKHTLLVGALGFFIATIIFVYLSFTRKKASLSHSLMFLSSAVATMAYYSMYNGLGVQYKTTDLTPRVIFWPRYVEQLFTLPVLSLASLYRFLHKARDVDAS